MTSSIRLLTSAGVLLLALSLFARHANAATFQIGATGVSDCSFWCTLRLQQVYDASLFSGPSQITRISFFASPTNGTAWDGIGTWQMSLSTSNNPVSALDLTFANNVGGDAAVFNTQTFPAGTMPANAPISFNGSFNYYPGMGDLLIDIQRTAGTAVGVGMDAGFAPGLIDRAWSHDSTVTAFIANQNHYALRTEIEWAPIPEPGSAILVALGAIPLLAAWRRRRRTAH